MYKSTGMDTQHVQQILVEGTKAYRDVTDDIIYPAVNRPGKWWYISGSISLLCALIGLYAMFLTFRDGIGLWGVNRTVGWGWAITNLVWWIGIGHAGTFISAVLLLFRQKWRTGINRSAEAMTIFALVCAGLFPVLHLGRAALVHFIVPYPNTRGLWVNFNSPLLWDVFAIGTYFTVSLLFWYTGMLPDLATMRDKARSKRRQRFFGILSLGWDGNSRTWARHETMSRVLAGLATPLVLSVHSIVSFDFAVSIVPGWHSTIFPPYFVAGAIFSGFAMVLTLMLIARKTMNLQQYITINHIESMNKIVLVTGSLVALAYVTELFTAWYSGNEFEQFAFKNRMSGPYAWAYYLMVLFNVLLPQLLWFVKLRRNLAFTFIASVLINIGMWLERFVIVVGSLHRDYLPSMWTMYKPTLVEAAIFLGTIGIFFGLFLLFIRFFPVVAIAEVKSVLKVSAENFEKGGRVHV